MDNFISDQYKSYELNNLRAIIRRNNYPTEITVEISKRQNENHIARIWF